MSCSVDSPSAQLSPPPQRPLPQSRRTRPARSAGEIFDFVAGQSAETKLANGCEVRHAAQQVHRAQRAEMVAPCSHYAVVFFVRTPSPG